jgi:hypothetical protein
MNQDDPIRVAKDKKSTHEMLTGLVGVSDDVDRLLARHPSATAEILSRLSKSSDATVRRRVLANPATPKDVLISLGPKYPATFFKNPALDSILRADKKFLLAFEAPTLLKLLGHKDCPAYFGEWALKKGSAEQQAVYLFKCRRPDAVMQKFTKSKHFEIAAALLENVDCIYESWARELGWIPDPPEDLGLDDEPIPIRMQIDYWVETTSEKCNPLWKTLVPEEGVAETVQGELVRAIGRIQGEFYKNGMMNWGSGFYESFKDYLAVWLKSDATYDSFTKKIIDADIWQIEKSGETGKTIAEGKLSRSAIFGGNILNTTDVEVSHRRIGALVSLWCEAHPDAISNNSYVMPRDRVAQLRSPAEYLTLTTPCNICGGVVKETDLDFQCVGKGSEAQGCGFSFDKLPRCGFGAAEVEQLLMGRKIGPRPGVHSRDPVTLKLRPSHQDKGNKYDLDIEFVANGDAVGEEKWADFSAQSSIGTCPRCAGEVFMHDGNYVCAKAVSTAALPLPTCDFKSPQMSLQQPIEPEQMKKLLDTGKTDLLRGFVSARTGRQFNAYLAWNPELGRVHFEFEATSAAPTKQ